MMLIYKYLKHIHVFIDISDRELVLKLTLSPQHFMCPKFKTIILEKMKAVQKIKQKQVMSQNIQTMVNWHFFLFWCPKVYRDIK